MKIMLKGLNNFSFSDLNEAFEALDPSVNQLALTYKSLTEQVISNLLYVFTRAPKSISTISLGGNFLGKAPLKNLVTVLSQISTNFTTLKLRSNNLWLRNANELTAIFSSINPNVETLDLSSNHLNSKNQQNISQVFWALPSSIKAINLSNTNLHLLSLTALEQLKNKLPFIQSVTLSYNELKEMTLAQRKALSAIFPNVKMPTLIDREHNIYSPCSTIKLLKNLGLSKTLGIGKEVPSLLMQASFFVAKHKNDPTFKDYETLLPIEVNENVHSYLSTKNGY